MILNLDLLLLRGMNDIFTMRHTGGVPAGQRRTDTSKAASANRNGRDPRMQRNTSVAKKQLAWHQSWRSATR
jgi:hypothetical protein